MTNKQWHGSALWGKVNHFPGHSVHFPLENIDSTAIFAVFSGKVNHFSANQWHFPPNMRLLASAYICLWQKYCCASAIANLFALLSASAIFGYAGNTVHASAMQARRLALHVPPVVSVSPRPPVSSGRNMPMQMNLHCSRLLRIFAKYLIHIGMRFEKIACCKDSAARAGKIYTAHGEIETPIFMPVGTVGSVKGVYHRDLKDDIGAQIILGNTYHLYLRPGLDILKAAGGLHKFISWDRPILTDSGGFQIFSLSPIRKLTPEGCTFSSHIDGSRHVFTPENNMDTQRIIGADIVMALDECTPGNADFKYAKSSLALTKAWLERCIKRFDRTEPLYEYPQALFPIVQGCVYPELRREAAEHAASLDREGYAIGGLSVGEPTEVMYEMLETVCPILPDDRPRYLMGVGTPANILEGIDRGVDMFDCVMPTRNGRNGMLFTWNGIMNMRNQKWADDFSPIDPDGDSFVDRYYSKAYLRHLFIAKEIFAGQIASEHNLAFYLALVREARRHIMAGDFKTWKEETVKRISTRL